MSFHIRQRRRRRVIGLLAPLGVVGAVVGLSMFALAPVVGEAAPAPVLLSQTWMQDLNDAPCGVAMASPVEATLDGAGPSVEVGDRQGDIYAFHIGGASQGAPTTPAGWTNGSGATLGVGQGCGISGIDNGTPATGVNGVTVAGNPAIDSTASVSTTANGTSELYFGAGNAAEPIEGGYYAYGASANLLWNQVVQNPVTDTAADGGVAASPAIGSGASGSFVTAGSLGQEMYTLAASNGTPAQGWPFFSADSIFSSAAVGDLYDTGSDEIVVGGASTRGFALGKHYQDGGHLRILNAHGGLICSADTNEEIDSSPAVGPILGGGALGIATGTGSYYAGAGDESTVKVFDTQCNQVWSRTLDGTTAGSPALADVDGNGLAIIEGTGGASVWALNATTGATIWHQSVIGPVLGSVTTADLTGQGYQDVIVPTTNGLEILDGMTGAEVAEVDNGNMADNTAAGVCAQCLRLPERTVGHR